MRQQVGMWSIHQLQWVAPTLIANASAQNAFFGIPGNYVMVDGFEIDCNKKIAQQGITTGDNTGGVAGHHL